MSNTAEEIKLEEFTVVLSTPGGIGEIDVPTTLGPEAAGRRAVVAAASIGWGDLDEIKVIEVKPIG